jgi:hypothetical protein
MSECKIKTKGRMTGNAPELKTDRPTYARGEESERGRESEREKKKVREKSTVHTFPILPHFST